VIVPAHPFVIESIDELPDQMQADPAGPTPSSRSGRGRRWRAARVVRLPVIRDLYRKNVVGERDANSELMHAAVGPAVFADIADDFIKNDLQLDQWLAVDTMLGGEMIQRFTHARRTGRIVVDHEFDGPQSEAPAKPFVVAHSVYTPAWKISDSLRGLICGT